jgi:CelD/BcsL family acetyltransferase involved in cellulose biosynthesis
MILREYKWSDWNSVADSWEEIWRLSPEQSPFLQPAWINAWLQTFGMALNPSIMMALSESTGDLLGCCLVTRRNEFLKRIPIRCAYINTAGENQADEVCIEYNDILAVSDCRDEFISRLLNHLHQSPLDQIIMPGVHNPETISILRAKWVGATQISTDKASFVDLSQIRGKYKDYESALSANTRTQIRRSRKLIVAEHGNIQLERANSVSQGLAFLQELAALHQSRGLAAGEPGAFQSKLFTAFHRQVLATLLPAGGVDLLRIRAGEQTVGILYNFVVRRKVYFYQSGVMKSADNRIKPGITTHSEAIQHYLDAGCDEYDMLAGESQYKRSLANSERDMQLVILENSTARMRMFSAGKRARAWIRSLPAKFSCVGTAKR